MVGTGVFASLGYQLVEFDSGFALMLLWLLGGICALCGAVSYCELAAAVPRSGGEYTFLREAFHPAVGFIAGWVSFTVGFSAPAALVAMTFGAYLAASVEWVHPTFVAIGLILIGTALHAYSHQSSGGFQTIFTLIKIALIVVFCIVCYALVEQRQTISFAPVASDLGVITSGGFAISLVYVSYSYAGWNSTTYVLEEFNQPTRAINRALIAGTSTVLVLYLLLNGTFLSVAPTDAMKGTTEVGYVAASYAFGEIGAQLMSLMIAIILISTLSGMILAGPRVLSRMGNDYAVLGWLARTNRNGVPAIAIAIQSGLAILLILTGTFDSVLIFAGVSLGISAFATVSASIWLRMKNGKPERYHMPFYPLPPLVFLLITGWTIIHTFFERMLEGAFALGIFVSGYVLYLLISRWNRSKTVPSDREH